MITLLTALAQVLRPASVSTPAIQKCIKIFGFQTRSDLNCTQSYESSRSWALVVWEDTARCMILAFQQSSE